MKNTSILILCLSIITAACISADVPIETTSTYNIQKEDVPIETPNTYNIQKEDTSKNTINIVPYDINQKTNTERPWTLYDFDVIVVGESSGAICAAVAATEGGASVVVISDVNYLGGQITAAGVSTMDEMGAVDQLRSSGCYKRLIEDINKHYGDASVSMCYFSKDSICPEPNVIRDIFKQWLDEADVTILYNINIDKVLQRKNIVLGVIDSAKRIQINGHIVIDGTEFSDLYPLIDGLTYEVGDVERQCSQHTTWLAIRNWYPDGVPESLRIPIDAIYQLKDYYGDELVDGWLAEFQSRVSLNGISEFPGWIEWQELNPKPKWSPNVEHGYRGLADTRIEILTLKKIPTQTRSGLNHINDSITTPKGIDNPNIRQQELQMALHKTYAYLWYEYYELNVTDWGVSNDLGYSEAKRLFWDEPNIIPNAIEKHLPPIPYTREARRLIALDALTWSDITNENRGKDQFNDSVMIGGYFADSHGCNITSEKKSRYGMYDVPIGIFIPEKIDGFLPGLVRAAGVDRVASSSLRMQPTEMLGGEVAGTLAALAVKSNTQPRNILIDVLRKVLLARNAVIDVPEINK